MNHEYSYKVATTYGMTMKGSLRTEGEKKTAWGNVLHINSAPFTASLQMTTKYNLQTN